MPAFQASDSDNAVETGPWFDFSDDFFGAVPTVEAAETNNEVGKPTPSMSKALHGCSESFA